MTAVFCDINNLSWVCIFSVPDWQGVFGETGAGKDSTAKFRKAIGMASGGGSYQQQQACYESTNATRRSS